MVDAGFNWYPQVYILHSSKSSVAALRNIIYCGHSECVVERETVDAFRADRCSGVGDQSR